MSSNAPSTGLSVPVEDLKSIVGTLRSASPQATAGDSWYDAAITGTFSFSSGGGNLEGWISYYDGTKVHFQLVGKPTKIVGTAAGTFAWPLIRVRPADTFAGKTGTFNVSGFWAVGDLNLYCAGQPITQTSIGVVSVAPWDYEMVGNVEYTKA